MKQIATVVRVVAPDRVEVAVARQSACGHDCENCGGCAAHGNSITVTAVSRISVAAGDKVEIYSDNRVLAFAVLVYLVPILLFLMGYILPTDISETMRLICGGGGFALGIAAAVLCDRLVRSRNAVTYQIIRKL